MKLTYKGTGTVHVPGVGDVSHGGTFEIGGDLGKRLHEQSPEIWTLPKANTPRPPTRRGTGGA